MSRGLTTVLFIALMVTIIVTADLLFFRNHFWPRLLANVGIVLIFGAVYWVFLRRLV